MDETIGVSDITVERTAGVTIVFDDGRNCRFGLEDLRQACPCAACRGMRERNRAPWPATPNARPLEITTAELVGAWGLAIAWNDGHRAGIYPFRSLRQWCETGPETSPFGPDSGRGA